MDGLGAGIGAKLPKGSTLRVTTAIFTITTMRSRTSLSENVYANITYAYAVRFGYNVIKN
jgi:hypothetical protein